MGVDVDMDVRSVSAQARVVDGSNFGGNESKKKRITGTLRRNSLLLFITSCRRHRR